MANSSWAIEEYKERYLEKTDLADFAEFKFGKDKQNK